MEETPGRRLFFEASQVWSFQREVALHCALPFCRRGNGRVRRLSACGLHAVHLSASAYTSVVHTHLRTRIRTRQSTFSPRPIQLKNTPLLSFGEGKVS